MNLDSDDWVVQAHTVTELISLPLDYKLTDAVAGNLDNTHWPLRLISLYLLSKNGGSSFDKVLNWTAKHDTNNLVREMAIALGGKEPQVQQPNNQTGAENNKDANSQTRKEQ